MTQIELQALRGSLPPIQAEISNANETLVDDGSFLNSDHPVQQLGRKCLQDPETKLPYLYLPVEIAAKTADEKKDTYHHLYYYRLHPHLGGGSNVIPPEDLSYQRISGLALRVSVGQYLMRSTHQRGHDKFPAGPTVPETFEIKFRRAVMASTGITPRQVVDVRRKDEDELVDVDEATFAKLASSAYTGVERYRSVYAHNRTRRVLGLFFARYAARQDLSHVPSSTKNEFLFTNDTFRRNSLAALILAAGLEVAIEPFEPTLQRYRKLGMVVPGKKDTLTELKQMIPASVVGQVVSTLSHQLLLESTG